MRIQTVALVLAFCLVGYCVSGNIPANPRQGSEPVFSITPQGVEILNPASDAGDQAIGAVSGHRATQFTGRRYEPLTGQYWHRNRFMNPKWGRFTSRDKLGFDADINLYRYANANPVRHTDPFGLWKLTSPINSNKVYAIAEMDGEDESELGNIWGCSTVYGSGDWIPIQLLKVSGPCDNKVHNEDQYDITYLLPTPMANMVGILTPANCFGAARNYPNITDQVVTREAFQAFLETSFGIGNGSWVPKLGSFAAYRSKIDNEEKDLKKDQLSHVGIVIYISKVTGNTSIFQKGGITGRYTIENDDFLSEIYNPGWSYSPEYWGP